MVPADSQENKTYWKRCSSCKKEIGFNAKYQLCSVSTCQGKKTGLIFCSVPCWDAHLGFAHHRDAAAEEHQSPSKEAIMNEIKKEESVTESGEPRKIIVRDSESSSSGDLATLVVVSKVKGLVRQLAGMNTSQCAVDALTEAVARECKNAIERAKTAGRKTVMGRDFQDE